MPEQEFEPWEPKPRKPSRRAPQQRRWYTPIKVGPTDKLIFKVVSGFILSDMSLIIHVFSPAPPGEAGRSVGSVQERIRPGIPDETSSWRWGEPAPPLHLHFIFIFTLKTRKENPVFSKQAKWLIQRYNLVITCNFWDCSVGNSHLKAFYEQLGWHRRFQRGLCGQSSICILFFLLSVTSLQDHACRWAACTASTQQLSADFPHTQRVNELLIPPSPSKLPLFRSTVPFCARPLIPCDPQKTTSAVSVATFKGSLRLFSWLLVKMLLRIWTCRTLHWSPSKKSWHHRISVCLTEQERAEQPRYLTLHGVP